jgi:membrane protease YdiL (CAAX protease family)
MFMGILLGAAYWYSGSLWVSILAHFFINAAQVIAVSYYPKMIDEDPYVPVYWALASLAIVVGLLSIFRRRSRTSYAEVYANNDNNTPWP